MNDNEVKNCIRAVGNELGLHIKSVSRRPLTNVWQVFTRADEEIRFEVSPGATVEECAGQFRALFVDDRSRPFYVEEQIDNLRRRKASPDDVLAAENGLKAVGGAAMDLLTKALLTANEPSYFRSRVAETLSEMADSRAIAPLIHVLEERDVELRWSAVKALEKIGDETAIAPLEKLASTESGSLSFGGILHISVKDDAQEALNRIKQRIESKR